MSQNQCSGPKVGQSVIYSPSAGVNYAAIITQIQTGGLARLTTLPPGGTTPDVQNVPFDYTGNIVFPSWRFHGEQSGI